MSTYLTTQELDAARAKYRGAVAPGLQADHVTVYEIITFTTVGYGDIIPHTAQGKLLAICTALLGATHGVTFVALVLQALTQHPPAKSQE